MEKDLRARLSFSEGIRLSKDGHDGKLASNYHWVKGVCAQKECLLFIKQSNWALRIQMSCLKHYNPIACSGGGSSAGENVQGQWGKAQQLLVQ